MRRRVVITKNRHLFNFDHITAYWVGMGMKLAQVALSYGSDDLHGTIIKEHIFHMAGATSPRLQTEAEMIKAIREDGRTPVNGIRFTNRSKFGSLCRRPVKLNPNWSGANPKWWKII